MGRLDGKRALITGATSGIGLEAARRFIEEGAALIVTGSTQVGADEAARRLGRGTVGVGADSLSLLEQRRLAGAVKRHFGTLDVAFLNAGTSDWRPFDRHDENSYDRLFDVNVKGPYFLVSALASVLADGASVILTSSNAAHDGFAYGNVYSATKAAVSSLVKSWNAELLRERGIRFNAVSPGPTDTPLFDKPGSPFASVTAAKQAIVPTIPLGRFATSREVADAVVYLASDESAFTAGQDLVLDGGRSLP